MFWKLLDKIAEYMNKASSEYLEKSDKYRRIVVLDRHKIRHTFETKKKIEDMDYVYDENTYINGNIFIKGKTNPIHINTEKLHLESSERYKAVLKSSILKDIFNPSNKIETLIFIILMASVGSLVVSIINMLGVV